MKRVDILGLQGSGKSTLLKSFHDACNNKSVTCFDNAELIQTYYIRKIGLMPLMSIPVLSSILKLISEKYFLFRSVHKRKQIEFIRNNNDFFCNIVSSYQTANQDADARLKVLDQVLMTYGNYELALDSLAEDEYLILDEGISYRPISLYVSADREISDEEIIRYFKHIRLPDLIISIVSSVETSIERMEKRGFPSRIADYDLDKKMTYLNNVVASLTKIESYMKSKGVDIYKVKNDGDTKALIDEVEDIVKELI